MIKATGTFKNLQDFAAFLGALQYSELSQPHHHASPMQIEFCNALDLNLDSLQITMMIDEHAEFLIEASLNDGLLRFWGNKFELIKMPNVLDAAMNASVG